jgi:hypothetical protein
VDAGGRDEADPGAFLHGYSAHVELDEHRLDGHAEGGGVLQLVLADGDADVEHLVFKRLRVDFLQLDGDFEGGSHSIGTGNRNPRLHQRFRGRIEVIGIHDEIDVIPIGD